MQASLILLDERDARKVAKSLGLQVTGLLGIILRAKNADDSLSILDIIKELSEKAGFHISPQLLADITNS